MPGAAGPLRRFFTKIKDGIRGLKDFGQRMWRAFEYGSCMCVLVIVIVVILYL